MSVPPIIPAAPEALSPVQAAPQIGRADAFESALRQLGAAASPPGQLAERVAAGLQAFQSRAQGVSRDMAVAFAPPAQVQAPAAPPAPGSAAPAGAVATPPPAGDAGGVQSMYRTMVRSFDFAMETHLVAKAATQFTGSINTLVKGQ